MFCGKFKAKSKAKQEFLYEQYTRSRKLQEQQGAAGGRVTPAPSDSTTDTDKVSSVSMEVVASPWSLRESGYSSGSFNPSAASSEGMSWDAYSPPPAPSAPGPPLLAACARRVESDRMSDIYQTPSVYSAAAPSHIMPGHLKIALYVNQGLLTVHVVEGEHIVSRRGPQCSSFVKVGLIPDRDPHGVCQTSTKRDTNNPVFDDKFTFELREEDRRSRVLVSLWNRSDGRCEFLGCMSFGVKHLLTRRREVRGWYHLLSQGAGTRKHLQVNNMAAPAQPSSSGFDNALYNRPGLGTTKIFLSRGEEGFGFTVAGFAPVRIGRVTPRSAAAAAGLRCGDAVRAVNGQDVSSASADVVANIIMNASSQILMEVERSDEKENVSPQDESAIYEQLSVVTDAMSLGQTPAFQRQQQRASVRSRNSSSSGGGGFYGSLPPGLGSGSRHGSSQSLHNLYPTYHGLQNQLLSVGPQHSLYGQPSLPMYSSTPIIDPGGLGRSRRFHGLGLHPPDTSPVFSNVYEDVSGVKEQWVDASPMGLSMTEGPREPFGQLSSEHYSKRILSDHSNRAGRNHSGRAEKSRAQIHSQQHSMRTSALIGGLLPMKTVLPVIEEDYDCSPSGSEHRSSRSNKGKNRSLDPLSQEEGTTDYLSVSNSESMECVTPLPELSTCPETTMSPAPRLRRAVSALISCEAAFVAQMARGVQRYAQPLRHAHNVVTREQHSILFTNIEKLVAISESHVAQLQGRGSPVPDPQSSVGAVYQPRLDVMCDAYDKYNQRLPRAISLLQDLHLSPEFHHFLESSSSSDFSLEQFLNKPVKHFQLLLAHFSKMLQILPTPHHDFNALTAVVTELKAHSLAARVSPVPMNCSTPACSPSRLSGGSEPGSPGASPQLPRAKTPGSALVDAELRDLEQRLVFPCEIQVTEICRPGRHVVFSAHVFISEDSEWTKAWAILLSDLLLLTREEDERLTVLLDPIRLEFVLSIDDTSTPSELAVVTREQRRYGTLSSRTTRLVLRAASREERCVWKTLIDQRARCTLQQAGLGALTA